MQWGKQINQRRADLFKKIFLQFYLFIFVYFFVGSKVDQVEKGKEDLLEKVMEEENRLFKEEYNSQRRTNMQRGVNNIEEKFVEKNRKCTGKTLCREE